MVFQSQNERGKDVEPQILIKARIFGEAEQMDEKSKMREIKGRWTDIYRRFENELGTHGFGTNFECDDLSLSQILVNSDTPTPTRIDKSSLYRNFDETLQNTSGLLEFVKNFTDQTDEYLQLSSSRYEINSRDLPQDAERHLQYFNAVSTHAEVLSLAIKNRVDDNSLLTEFFRIASVLGMRMELGGRRSEENRDAVYSAARNIHNSDDIRATLKQTVENRTPTDTEIIEHLKANDLTIRGQWAFRTSLLLASIEEERRGPWRIDFDDLHLEHIAPRNTFNKPMYVSWQRELDIEEDDLDDYVNKLGNLTLLSPSDHSKLDESSFDKKRRTYRDSDIKITEGVSAYDEWTSEEIDERTERLANELTDRWSV